MSAKGAWARKGGAQLFPKNAQNPAPSISPQLVAPKPAAPNPATSKPAVNVDKTSASQQPVAKAINEDVSAESLATFFASEQKMSESNGPRTIPEWNGYLTNLWERLRRDNVGCPNALKTFINGRFEEIVGWNGTEFIASQVITARQLELLFGLLLNHLSNAQNYAPNSVVSKNMPLSARAAEKKTNIANLKLDVVEHKSTNEKGHGDGGKSHHERKGRGRQSRGRNNNRSSNNAGSGHTPGVQYTGKVTRWGSQGFGFIKPDDGGEDLHVNSSDLVGDFNALIVGRKVVFTKRYNERARKYKACRVSGEACTTNTNALRGGQRRPRRRHHRGGNGGYGDNGGKGGAGASAGGSSYSSNSSHGSNMNVGFNVSTGGYGGVQYGGVPYGGMPYTFGGFPGGGFSYGGGFQSPPLSPTGAPGYGSPSYGGMSYGGPPISPVGGPSDYNNGGVASSSTGGSGAGPEAGADAGADAGTGDETAPPAPPAPAAAP